jgi:hypothetical protein
VNVLCDSLSADPTFPRTTGFVPASDRAADDEGPRIYTVGGQLRLAPQGEITARRGGTRRLLALSSAWAGPGAGVVPSAARSRGCSGAPPASHSATAAHLPDGNRRQEGAAR